MRATPEATLRADLIAGQTEEVYNQGEEAVSSGFPQARVPEASPRATLGNRERRWCHDTPAAALAVLTIKEKEGLDCDNVQRGPTEQLR